MLFRGRQAVYKQVSLIVTLLYKHILLERLLYYKSIEKKVLLLFAASLLL